MFADPGNQQARDLQAEAFEQLGYQSEGPQWRNIFLTAAQELREGVSAGNAISTATLETILAMPVGILLDYIAVRLNGPRADGTRLAINVTLTDMPGLLSVKVQNGVLHHCTHHTRDADLTLTLTKAQLAMALLQPDSLDQGIAGGSIKAEGDTTALRTLTGLLDTFDPHFNLVTPNAAPPVRGLEGEH